MSIARNLSILADYLNSAGTLNTAGGGTASTLTATQGGIAYGDGTKLLFTGAGTAGQYLQSTGTGAPSWTTINALPTQTGNSGKYLTTDGSAASWAAVPTTVISSTPPSQPIAGTKWLNTSTGYEYTYYVDVDSSQWIEVAQPSDNLYMILGNLDGGTPTSNYGGTTAIIGGTP